MGRGRRLLRTLHGQVVLVPEEPLGRDHRPNGPTCYGQIEDAGPSHDDLYHDAAYVFGTDDVRPAQHRFNNAGLDVSPALNGCLGFADLDGDSDRVSWRFADDADVPDGPWRRLVTKSGVTR